MTGRLRDEDVTISNTALELKSDEKAMLGEIDRFIAKDTLIISSPFQLHLIAFVRFKYLWDIVYILK